MLVIFLFRYFYVNRPWNPSTDVPPTEYPPRVPHENFFPVPFLSPFLSTRLLLPHDTSIRVTSGVGHGTLKTLILLRVLVGINPTFPPLNVWVQPITNLHWCGLPRTRTGTDGVERNRPGRDTSLTDSHKTIFLRSVDPLFQKVRVSLQ